MIDSGWWTKVLFDEDGNVLDVDNLTEEDLPSHTHSLDDISGEELDTRIKKALEGFFIDHDGSSVQFDFNDSDDEPTLEASVKIDEETIKMNEYGQLYVDLSELNIEGGSGSGSELDIDELKEKILAEINVPEMPELSEGSGIKIDKVDGLNILGVAVDGYTIKVDQDTNEIYVDTQILADILGSGDGSGNGSTSCGSHTHTVDQIQDFRKEVIEIIKKNVTFEIDDLSSLIDGTTIKIDSNGKLYSVAGSSVKAHRHLLKDIDDWDPSWTIKAVFQSLASYIEDRSLDLHYLKFESMDLGFALYTIDNELYKTELQIKNLEKRIANLEVTDESNPGKTIGLAYLDGVKTEAFYKKLGVDVEVYLQGSVRFIIPAFNFVGGMIDFYFDGDSVGPQLIDTIKLQGKVGIYSAPIAADQDGEPIYNLEIRLPTMSKQYDGVHTVYAVYTAPSGAIYKSPIYTFYSTPWRNLEIKEFKESLTTHAAIDPLTRKQGEYYTITERHLTGKIFAVLDDKHQFYPKSVNKTTGSITLYADELTDRFFPAYLGEKINCSANIIGLFGSEPHDFTLEKLAEESDPIELYHINSDGTVTSELNKSCFVFNNLVYSDGLIVLKTDENFKAKGFQPTCEVEKVLIRDADRLESIYTDGEDKIVLRATGKDLFDYYAPTEEGVITKSKIEASPYKFTTTIGKCIDRFFESDVENHFIGIPLRSIKANKLDLDALGFRFVSVF